MPAMNKTLAILALLAFFLPFITISCNGRPLVELTGAKLAQCAVSTCSSDDMMSPELKKLAGRNGPNVDFPMPQVSQSSGTDGANFVLFAAIACLLAALTLFFAGRSGELISGVASIAAIVLLFLFRNKFGDAVGPHLHSPGMDVAAAMVNIQLQFSTGFWLSIVLSAVSAILAFKGTAAAPSPVPVARAGSTSGPVQQPPTGIAPSGGQ